MSQNPFATDWSISKEMITFHRIVVARRLSSPRKGRLLSEMQFLSSQNRQRWHHWRALYLRVFALLLRIT
jgi:hypothetical protein